VDVISSSVLLRKIATALLAVAILGYLGIATCLYLFQDSLLYFPQHTRVAASQTDFALPRGGGVVLRGWVINPGRPRALLYFGGNGEPIQLLRPSLARWFPTWTVYLVAYRGYGASSGSPSQANLFADAVAIFDHVRARHTSVAVIGRSLGTGVAVYLASRRPVTRVALVTPYDSVARVGQDEFPLFPVALLLHDKYDSMRYAGAVRCPVLLIEAANDELISVAHSERLARAFPRAPRILRIAGAGHNTVQNSPLYAETLEAYFSAV